MIRYFFAQVAKIVSEFLHRPARVLVTCFLLIAAGLLIDGSLYQLWKLNHDSAFISERMHVLRSETLALDEKINKAKDPNFLEIEVRDRFELASEGDLIFVFSDDE